MSPILTIRESIDYLLGKVIIERVYNYKTLEYDTFYLIVDSIEYGAKFMKYYFFGHRLDPKTKTHKSHFIFQFTENDVNELIESKSLRNEFYIL